MSHCRSKSENLKSSDAHNHTLKSLDSLSPPVELSDFSAHRGAEEGRNEKKYPTNEGGVRMSAEGLAESGKPTVEKKEARRSSRREYLCLAAGLAVGAGATYLAMPKPPEETFSGKGATKVKITVLRTFGMNEVHPKGLPVKPKYTGSCEVFTEGQEFIVDAKRPRTHGEVASLAAHMLGKPCFQVLGGTMKQVSSTSGTRTLRSV